MASRLARSWCTVVVVLVVATSGCGSGEPDSPAGASPASGSEAAAADVALQALSGSECLPLDEAGWSHSTGVADSADEQLTGLAINDQAVVALMGDESTASWFIDGLAWRPAEGFPALDTHGCPATVAGGPAGFVAVGVRNGTPVAETPDTPVVAFSADGRRWEQIDPGTLPEDEVAWLTDVFAGPNGFLIVGALAEGDAIAGSFVWFSPDGRTWNESTLPAGDAIAMTATSDGWVALTAATPWRGSQQPQVWTSPDGINWLKVDTQSSPPDHAVGAYCATPPLVSRDDTWVLAATEGAHDRGTQDVTVWVSRDAGTTWEPYPVADVPGLGEHVVHDLAATEIGFVLTGWWDERPDGEHHHLLAYSRDGSSWDTCTVPEEIVRIATRDDTIVLVDDTGATHIWRTP